MIIIEEKRRVDFHSTQLYINKKEDVDALNEDFESLGLTNKIAKIQYIECDNPRRVFYSSNSKDDYLGYIDKGVKLNKDIDYLDYTGNLEKSSGVFNQNGLLNYDSKRLIRNALRNTKSCIWDLVISFESLIESLFLSLFIESWLLSTLSILSFYNCSNLTIITLSSTLQSIGLYAFNGCTSLTSIVIPESVTKIERSAFRISNSPNTNLIIYCEANSQPDDWDSSWNPNDRPVYWAGEWEYVDGVPTPISEG